MCKRTKMVVCEAACTVWLVLSLLSAVYACQVDDFYLTKEGNLAAVTPQALNDVLALAPDNQKLVDFMKKGTVLKLKDGVKVQVLERSVEWNMLKIQFPDGHKTYWVKDGSLKPIDCNK